MSILSTIFRSVTARFSFNTVKDLVKENCPETYARVEAIADTIKDAVADKVGALFGAVGDKANEALDKVGVSDGKIESNANFSMEKVPYWQNIKMAARSGVVLKDGAHLEDQQKVEIVTYLTDCVNNASAEDKENLPHELVAFAEKVNERTDEIYNDWQAKNGETYEHMTDKERNEQKSKSSKLAMLEFVMDEDTPADSNGLEHSM